MKSPRPRSYFRNFWVSFVVGTLLVILIMVLGIGFFNAIYDAQIESRRDFLTKQSELAARGLELEIRRFEEESKDLINYLEDPNHEIDDYDEEFTYAVRRLFNAFPQLIDSAWVDMQDSVLTFTFNERNDFFRKAVDQGFPESSSKPYANLVIGKKGFRVLYSLKFLDFAKEFAENYYLNPTGAKYLFFEDQLFPLNKSEISLTEGELDFIKKDLTEGVKGIYTINSSVGDGDFTGVAAQYPFRFHVANRVGAVVFVVPVESLYSGIYRTYFLSFFGFMILLISAVSFFVISLKNSFEFQRIQESNIQEIKQLFDQQNLLLQELRGFVFFHDHRGEITRVSPEVEQVLGHSPDEFVAAFATNSSHMEAKVVKKQVMDRIAQKQDVLNLEYDFVRPDGQEIRVRVFEKLIFDGEGNFKGGMGLGTDISLQYESQEQLRESENRLRNLIRSIPDIIFIYDNSGKILDFHIPSEAAEMMPPEDVKGKNLKDLFDGPDGEGVLQTFLNALQSRKIHSLEQKIPTKSGIKHFETRFFPLDQQQMISISKNITGQKIWEKGLMEAMEAADKASRAKSEFLANMSHEIRTPMNGLLGIIDLLEQTKLDKVQKQYADIIKNSGNMLLGIIKDILDYSKIEAGKIEIIKEVYDANAELENQAKILSGLASKKEIKFTFQRADEEDLFIEADKVKINQIFLNLAGNAIKFTPEGGEVDIRLEYDPLGEAQGFLSCTVKDSGIGISSDHLQHLSEPFYQIDSSKTRSHQGTGLGLAIAKKLTELLGGSFEVESQLGEGSTFQFSVLVKRVSSPEATDPKSKTSWKDIKNSTGKYPIKVLLAEDNELNIQLMGMMLNQLGFSYEIAKNGLEAVQMVEKNGYDMVLMDVQMPVMNGLEATQAIRKLALIKQPAIIGLSANVFDEDHISAIEAGMDDYLTKPIRLGVLGERLEYFFQKIVQESE